MSAAESCACKTESLSARERQGGGMFTERCVAKAVAALPRGDHVQHQLHLTSNLTPPRVFFAAFQHNHISTHVLCCIPTQPYLNACSLLHSVE